ncbi:Rhamnogalacturonyl hydrolase YesR [Granulicella pectinivorans]|uniref:Rhamnogalacturonyl hydrolase YesR n=1 Tax=Granulicella pectinivorans TaxID=474950 RepID=A0A1I6M2M3_9BACT|nr:glycoside hydrolase family 88 protein [Granulicella pectinivorans]SFS09931.1 Rhamnogalacturonyl hydrolase YesR [Granulicella pectinivorans]
MSVGMNLRMAAWVCVAGIATSSAYAQDGGRAARNKPNAAQQAGITKDNSRHFGDDPDDGGPMAKLSPKLNRAAVDAAARKVADWQLARSEPYFDRIWTWSVLYNGFVAASDAMGDPKYRDAMERMGAKYEWKLRSKTPNADDQSVGATYEEIFMKKKDPAMIAPLQADLDAALARPFVAKDDLHAIEWWWCDALFMAPQVWARMYAITGDKKYITYLDDEWKKTSDLLYDKQEHLYARDKSYLGKTEANGKKMFWSRGNGWVMGGIARTMPFLPKDDPNRAFYALQMREMAAKAASLQGKDGLWRAGLLDQEDYDQPEVSGSALMTYGMAWGVNEGILDAKVYRPVIERAWKGMLAHVYADGRLGCIQQTGAEPAPFKPTASYTYGVGGFLLAATEIRKMAKH